MLSVSKKDFVKVTMKSSRELKQNIGTDWSKGQRRAHQLNSLWMTCQKVCYHAMHQ